MKVSKFSVIILLCLNSLCVSAKDYLASYFGIHSDGIALNTRSIQFAIVRYRLYKQERWRKISFSCRQVSYRNNLYEIECKQKKMKVEVTLFYLYKASLQELISNKFQT